MKPKEPTARAATDARDASDPSTTTPTAESAVDQNMVEAERVNLGLRDIDCHGKKAGGPTAQLTGEMGGVRNGVLPETEYSSQDREYLRKDALKAGGERWAAFVCDRRHQPEAIVRADEVWLGVWKLWPLGRTFVGHSFSVIERSVDGDPTWMAASIPFAAAEMLWAGIESHWLEHGDVSLDGGGR